MSESNRKQAGLPILRPSTKRVVVANGEESHGNKVTALPIPQLADKDTEADTFDDFPTSLMSVGKPSDAGTIFIFTKVGVTVHKEEESTHHMQRQTRLSWGPRHEWTVLNTTSAIKGQLDTTPTNQTFQEISAVLG